jgi:TRAP-type C4-dicarboxylate transport system permease small subunit
VSTPPPGPAPLGLRAIRAVLGILILAGVALNFANVVGRYVFFAPIIWAEEVLVFIMVWCVMLGATLVTWENQHLRMDAVHHLTPPRVRRWLNLVGTLAFLLVAAFVLVQSLRVFLLATGTGQRSVVADVPMVIPFAAIPLSFAIIVGMLVWRFRRFARGDEEDGEESIPVVEGGHGSAGDPRAPGGLGAISGPPCESDR